MLGGFSATLDSSSPSTRSSSSLIDALESNASTFSAISPGSTKPSSEPATLPVSDMTTPSFFVSSEITTVVSHSDTE